LPPVTTATLPVKSNKSFILIFFSENS